DAAGGPATRPDARAPAWLGPAGTGRYRAGRSTRALVPAVGQGGDSPAARPRLRASRNDVRRPDHSRTEDSLGQLLARRHDELQLASSPGSRADPQLRGLARGVPPGDHGPLRPVLGAVARALAGLPR